MALQVPQMALGMDIKNANFARSAGVTSPDSALDWDADAGITEAAVFDASPRLGHARVQKYTLEGGVDDARVYSSRCSPGFLVKPGNISVSGFCHYKTDAFLGSGGNQFHLNLIWYDENGSKLGGTSTAQIISSTPATDWTFATESRTVVAPANAHHCRVAIRMYRVSGSTAFSIWLAFADVGTWKESIPAGSCPGEATPKYTWQVRPSLTNSFSVPAVSNRSIGKNTHGEDLQIINDRYAERYLTQLGIPLCDHLQEAAFHYAWNMNKGRTYSGSGIITGGCWPLILFTGSTDTYTPLKTVGLYNWEGSAFGIRPAQFPGWAAHPPYFGGMLRLRERI